MSKSNDELTIPDIIESIKLTNKTIDNLNYTKEEYYNYIDEIRKSENLLLFLQTLNIMETIESNEMETVNSFLTIFNYYKNYSKTAIDVALETLKQNDDTLDENVLNIIHKSIPNTLSEEKVGNYRNKEIWVGGYKNGVKSVEYIPPASSEIPKMMDELFRFYNKDSTSSYDDVLIKPFIIHALLGRIQPYFDGNKRIGRIIASIKKLSLTNKICNLNISMPMMQLSHNYKLYRVSYIDSLVNLYNNPLNNDYWNRWFCFNLNCINDQIEYFKREINSIERISHKKIG